MQNNGVTFFTVCGQLLSEVTADLTKKYRKDVPMSCGSKY
jgi:hypothetical protein